MEKKIFKRLDNDNLEEAQRLVKNYQIHLEEMRKEVAGLRFRNKKNPKKNE